MKKEDLIYKKIENFLIVNGCKAWQCQKGCFSEWGKKSNYFVLISDNMALKKALCFIDHNIRMRG